MITNEVKKQVEEIWLDLGQLGIKPATTAIEQISWLIYARLIDIEESQNDQVDSERAILNRRFTDKEQHLRWHKLIEKLDANEKDAQELLQVISEEVFPQFCRHRLNNLEPPPYLRGAKLLIEEPTMLARLVKKIDQLPLTEEGIGGECYEYLLELSGIFSGGGQYQTPGDLVRLMVELLEPKPADMIGDPACGTGSFFIESRKYIDTHWPTEHESAKNDLDPSSKDKSVGMRGFDSSATMMRIANVNLMLHGIENSEIYFQNTLSASFSGSFPDKNRNVYDLVFCNPPFGYNVDENKVAYELTHQVRSTRTELLFPVLALQMLSKGGRAAITIPTQALAKPIGDARQFRELLIKRYRLDAVIELPPRVMYPFTNTPVSILLAIQGGPTEHVFFYRMPADKPSGDQEEGKARRSEIRQGMSDCITRWQSRDRLKDADRKDKAFMVPVDEIREAGYDLTMNQYREIIYQAEVYEPPEKLLDHLKKLNQDIAKDLEALEGLLT